MERSLFPRSPHRHSLLWVGSSHELLSLPFSFQHAPLVCSKILEALREMETDEKPVQAKRRVTPTIVAREDADASSTGLGPNNSGDHDIFAPVSEEIAAESSAGTSKPTKKRGRPSPNLYVTLFLPSSSLFHPESSLLDQH